MHRAPADIIKKKVIFHLAGTRLSNTKPHLFSLSTKDLILFPRLLQRFTITLIVICHAAPGVVREVKTHCEHVNNCIKITQYK